jgi:hypothetical protein
MYNTGAMSIILAVHLEYALNPVITVQDSISSSEYELTVRNMVSGPSESTVNVKIYFR